MTGFWEVTFQEKCIFGPICERGMCCWGIKLLCQTQFSFFQRECGPAWSSSWFNNSHYRHHHISGFFPPELCHLLSTLMGDYEHKFHCITWFNWSSWLIMSAALGETKFWTWHFRFSTQKLPVIMGTWNYLWTRGISKWQSSGKNSSPHCHHGNHGHDHPHHNHWHHCPSLTAAWHADKRCSLCKGALAARRSQGQGARVETTM